HRLGGSLLTLGVLWLRRGQLLRARRRLGMLVLWPLQDGDGMSVARMRLGVLLLLELLLRSRVSGGDRRVRGGFGKRRLRLGGLSLGAHGSFDFLQAHDLPPNRGLRGGLRGGLRSGLGRANSPDALVDV